MLAAMTAAPLRGFLVKNSRWQTAAVLENCKIVMSQQWFDSSPPTFA